MGWQSLNAAARKIKTMTRGGWGESSSPKRSQETKQGARVNFET